MRRTLLATVLLTALGGCGDDGKTAPRGPPVAPAGRESPPMPAPGASTPPPVEPAAPSGVRPAAPSSWAATRVGDSATWEIRVVGSTSVTRLTWRATRVEAGGVRYAVQARTLNVEGATLTLVETEEFHAPIDEPAPKGVAETLTVAGVPVATERSTRANATIWRSSAVPFSGLVRSTSPDVEQTLVAFSRGS